MLAVESRLNIVSGCEFTLIMAVDLELKSESALISASASGTDFKVSTNQALPLIWSFSTYCN